MSDKTDVSHTNHAAPLSNETKSRKQKYSEKGLVAHNLKPKAKPDIRFVSKGGYSVLDYQSILKTKSKKLYEWCNGYIPGVSERVIIVSNVEEISIKEFLKMVHSDDVALNEDLSEDILVEVLYLIEKFWTMDKYFKFQLILLRYFRKILTAFYSVIVFIKAREFHLKDMENVAWGFICGFVKKVDKLRVTMNQDSISKLIKTEKIPEDSLRHFEHFFRFGVLPVQPDKDFEKSTNFLCSVALISFLQRLKWCMNEFGESSNLGTENITKYLIADSFYSFCNDAFIDESIDIQSRGENPSLNGQNLLKDRPSEKNNVAPSKRTRPNLTPPKNEKEFFVRRLTTCSEFIFPNRGLPESLSFICDKAINIVKLGLFGCHDVPSYINEYQVRASIVDAKKNLVIAGTFQYFRDTGSKYYIHFDKPVLIMPNKKYTIVVRIKGPPSCIGLKKHTMVKIKCDSTIVTVYFPPDEKDFGMKIPEFFFTIE